MNIKKLIQFLVCPYCKNQDLLLTAKKIICKNCNTEFNIIEGIPVLIKKDKLQHQELKQQSIYNNHYSKFPKEKYELENWRLSMLNRIFQKAFCSKIKTYLDIGCGATGYTVIEAAKRRKWLSFGVDISLEAMIRAKHFSKKLGVEDNTAFIVCSAENLPFKTNTFDYVSAISVLEHVENDKKIIKNIYKILRKSGYMYICVPNTYKRMWPFLWLFYYYFDLKVGHKRHYSIEELNDKINKGRMFELVKVFYNGHLIKFLQLFLEKIDLINENIWWKMEKKDINNNFMGVQLNAVYKKLAY